MFLFLIGFAGWAAIASTVRAGAAWPSIEAAALFLVVIAGTRSLSFPLAGLDGNAEISLDSAIFIAATACLGGPVTAAGVGVLLSTDAVVRAVRGRKQKGGRLEAWSVLARTVYAGGLSGGLIALLSRLFITSAPVHETWRVPALGATFLIVHYLMQTVQLRLGGQSFRAAIRRSTIGVVCEATLVPLACAIVLIWDPRHPVPFALLGGTYLLVNFGFNRLAHLAKAMRQRALELETLNRTAHALGNSLETPQLIGALLREAVRALPAVSRLEAIVASGGSKVERFAIDGRGTVSVEPADLAARGWLRLKEPVVDERDGEDSLGVPLVMYGETIGALVATSTDEGAFGSNEIRLLDAIAGQAATAVENARLYTLANIDGLTGLYVRRYFDLRVAEEVERARRFSTSFALVLLDLDDFKRLNDSLGHLAGDRALREVAAIAASQLRGVDLAARYGGEELAFLLPRTSLVDAHAVAERIRAAVASHRIVENGRAMTVTASIGVAAWAESGVDEPQSLIARADAALYRAKAAGKNRVEIDLVTFDLSPSLAPIRRRRA